MLKVGFGVTRAQIIGGHDGIGTYTNELYRQFSKLNDQLDIYPFILGGVNKIPVITSITTSLPEVVGDSALLVNPTDTSSIALDMQKIIEHQTLSLNLIKKGYLRALDFSCENKALKTLDVYHQVLMKRS